MYTGSGSASLGLMRTLQLACFASLALLGCGRASEPDHDDRPYAPPSPAIAQDVQVRNSCPEAVTIAISATVPGPSTPTKKVGSTKVESVTVEQGARIWLQYDGKFEEELSVVPTGSVEIGYQCSSIYSREGHR